MKTSEITTVPSEVRAVIRVILREKQGAGLRRPKEELANLLGIKERQVAGSRIICWAATMRHGQSSLEKTRPAWAAFGRPLTISALAQARLSLGGFPQQRAEKSLSPPKPVKEFQSRR
jgi:hypothetical protein